MNEVKHLGKLEINLYFQDGKTLKQTKLQVPQTKDKVFDNEVLKMLVAEIELIKGDIILKILDNMNGVKDSEF